MDPAGPPPLLWKRTTVDERSALYAVVGEPDGVPVVLAHGWALGQRSYRRAMERLAAIGCRVHAPALPGFGGTAALPSRSFSLAGYAAWLEGFVDAVGITEPVVLVGHSFGGGVSIRFAHDCPDRVRSLVLVNSIGGSAWRGEGSSLRTLADRPLWDWGLHFPADLLPLRQITRVLPVVLEDAIPNLLRNPLAVARVADLARRVDLTAELEELKRRELPVVVLWGRNDRIVPRASFEALCAAIGAAGEVVDGNHSWLLADPDGFVEVITNVVEVAAAARALDPDDEGGELEALPGAGSMRRRLAGVLGR